MSEKICEGCLKKVEFYTVDREQDYSETFLEPPPEQHPELDKLVTIKIENSKFKNRKIYYFAAKHCSKFNLPEKTNLCENNRSTFIDPIEAYGRDFTNSGVSEFNEHGIAIITLEKPLSYHVKSQSTNYDPHIHFKIADETSKIWEEEIYTLSIN